MTIYISVCDRKSEFFQRLMKTDDIESTDSITKIIELGDNDYAIVYCADRFRNFNLEEHLAYLNETIEEFTEGYSHLGYVCRTQDLMAIYKLKEMKRLIDTEDRYKYLVSETPNAPRREEDDPEEDDAERELFGDLDALGFSPEEDDADDPEYPSNIFDGLPSVEKKDRDISSRVVRSIKRPKKSVNRHGILVTDNKKALKKDAKRIRAFLEEFIPGDGWQEDYRETVLERWMCMFAISENRFEELKKRRKKGRVKKRKSSTTVKRGYDSIWSDPNR